MSNEKKKIRKKKMHMHARHRLFKNSQSQHENKANLPLSLPPSSLPLPLPAVPSRSPAKLGGRCCYAKLALKCLPGSPVSPTTQSNHIRSLYLCLGQVRHCSCVHPRSTFGVEGPPALNVRPQKKKKKKKKRKKTVSLSFSVSLLHLLTIQQSGSGRQH